MLQRIQSIFLFLAGLASFLLLAFPFAATPTAVAGSTLFADGQFGIDDNIGVTIFFLLGGGLAFLAIFMFKNRTGQIRLSILAFIANLIGLVLAIVFFMQENQLGETPVEDKMGLYMPIIAFITLLLAIRYIQKDDKLVSSMDRLR
ncbi:MAG: DUF4293 domain-containing protein [Saprospiraceae bacterium]|nr:DUF4293 domain-containing protein [Saprospiraceae bacterium]